VPCRCCRWGQSPEALYIIWQRTFLIRPIRGSWRSSRIRRKIAFPRTGQSSCEFFLPTCSAQGVHHSSARAEIIVEEQNHNFMIGLKTQVSWDMTPCLGLLYHENERNMIHRNAGKLRVQWHSFTTQRAWIFSDTAVRT